MQTVGFQDWRARGSYFECCNCDAVCSMPERPRPTGWPIDIWHLLRHVVVARGRRSCGPTRPVQPQRRPIAALPRHSPTEHAVGSRAVRRPPRRRSSTPGARGHLPRSRRWTVADLYGPAIGEVHAVRRAQINVEHVAARNGSTSSAISPSWPKALRRSGRCSVRHSRIQPPWHRVLRAGIDLHRRGAAMGDPRRRPSILRNRLRLSLNA